MSAFCPLCKAPLKPAATACGKCAAPVTEGFWRPDRWWHLKALTGIFIFLGVVYTGLNWFLSRVSPPYRLREIPPELTPWLKK
jgi:hypothetical protein